MSNPKKMPLLPTTAAISGIHPDITVNLAEYFFEKNFFILIGIFYE